MVNNPLQGPNNYDISVRFPDMSQAYDKKLIEHAETCAVALGIDVKKGVYVGNTGPVYETPAEVNMFRILGGDAVGMSTVPEVTVASYGGIGVLVVLCICNWAAVILGRSLLQEECIENIGHVDKDL